jgi:hypothetical protein
MWIEVDDKDAVMKNFKVLCGLEKILQEAFSTNFQYYVV